MSKLNFRPLAASLGFALAGLLLLFHPTLFSGFRRMQTDPGDTRVTNYTLEHTYRWMWRDPLHRSYRAPPVYFPAPNSQPLIGGGLGTLLLFAPWRLASLPPDTAFQLWMMAVALANFAAFCLFLRGGLGVSVFAASAGAFLFAFALPRANFMHHPQMAPAIFLALALWCLARFLRPGEVRAARFGVLFFGFWLAQLFCDFTLFWFFSLTLVIALLWSLTLPPARAALFTALKRHWVVVLGGALTFTLVAGALSWHDLSLLNGANAKPESIAYALLPRIQSWINAGPGSWVWGRFFAGGIFNKLHGEHQMGFGIVTLLLILWGLRRKMGALSGIMLCTGATLVALTTVFPVNLSLWSIVAAGIPGAQAVERVTLISLIVLIPAACGLAWAVERLLAHSPRWLLALLLAVVALEQGMTTWSYDKFSQRADVERIQAAVGPECRAFLATGDNPDHYEVSFKYHTDAMFAGLALNLPTLNGPYGRSPSEMAPFASVLVGDEPGRQRTRLAIQEYAARNGLNPVQVCWVHVDQPINW